MELIVYGIKSCDTVKKATTWLDKHKIKYLFHDYKKEGITETKLKKWSKQVGWELLLNKKGTTWKKLSPDEQASITSEKAALAVLKEHTSMIKRPLIERGEEVLAVGFQEEVFKKLFS